MNNLPLLRPWTLIHSVLHNLINPLSPPSLRKYKWHPGLLSGKMLRRYFVRLRIYSWPMIYLPPHWCLRTPSLISSGDVGRRQQEATRKLKVSGGTHQSADYYGWPASGSHHWPPPLARKLPGGSPWPCHMPELLECQFSCSGGPFDPCDDTCRTLIPWTFVPWIMTCNLAPILAQFHLHQTNTCRIC